jgi:hypothetical protein
MRLMVITEEELRMSGWKVERVEDVQLVPVDKAACRQSRAGIHREIFRVEEQLIQKYDPVAIAALEARREKLYAIIHDLNKVINI